MDSLLGHPQVSELNTKLVVACLHNHKPELAMGARVSSSAVGRSFEVIEECVGWLERKQPLQLLIRAHEGCDRPSFQNDD